MLVGCSFAFSVRSGGTLPRVRVMRILLLSGCLLLLKLPLTDVAGRNVKDLRCKVSLFSAMRWYSICTGRFSIQAQPRAKQCKHVRSCFHSSPFIPCYRVSCVCSFRGHPKTSSTLCIHPRKAWFVLGGSADFVGRVTSKETILYLLVTLTAVPLSHEPPIIPFDH